MLSRYILFLILAAFPFWAQAEGGFTILGTSFQDCPECPEMVRIPPGDFTMGDTHGERERDENPPRHVVIAYPLAIAKYEVTFEQWDICHQAGGCTHNAFDEGWGRGQLPVIHVSWQDAQQYAAWLSRKTGKSYRLLTEAEWEYAARASTRTKYWWGAKASRDFANYGQDDCCQGFAEGRDRWVNTSPVGSFPANPFGLHDMHGNVLEWVEDCYADTYADLPGDGSAYVRPGGCKLRVLRGGSWKFGARALGSSYRVWGAFGNRSGGYGFRVARTIR